MELLDKLILPVNGTHLLLLRFFLTLALLIFFSYSGLLLGSTLISSWLKRRENINDEKLSRDFIDLATSAPSIWFGMGIVPFLAVILLYAQFLHGLNQNITSYMSVGFLIYCAALATIYTYKSSLISTTILENTHTENVEIHKFQDKNNSIAAMGSFWSPVLLIVSLWLMIAGISGAINPETWTNSIMANLFSVATIFRLLHFVGFAIAFSAISYIYFNFWWEGGREYNDASFGEYGKSRSQVIALSFTAIQPVLFGFSLVTTPSNAVSYITFALAALSGILFLIGAHHIYALIKDKESKYIKSSFWFVASAFIFYIAQDQISFKTSTEANTIKIAEAFEKAEAEKAGPVEQPARGGEEIYKNVCSSCHKFDVKQATAPAYFDVVPKYIGHQDEMLKFIQDPQGNRKNRADYPNGMTPQSLNSKEYKNVSDYILEQVKKHEAEKK